MTDIAPFVVKEVYSDHQRWIYQDISHQEGRINVTLDLSKFTANTHYPKGFLPSGIPLGKVTATGLYGPYDNGASDGREKCEGFLYAFRPVRQGQERTSVALWVGPGIIKEGELPLGALDSAGKTDLNWFKFVA
ncbi:head decoration [Gordonia phage Yvonnetastic]|uniref:Head decoration protein n=1 Tax=Gordonia phage Yvonnetastic TaxID=1821566 RepID=A0A142K8Z3_9CAUD|nr:head decoration [Gordonia phage Yvonnetastic]AMS02576.1 head decoration protein [Gordonia phage Yvonnetastic]